MKKSDGKPDAITHSTPKDQESLFNLAVSCEQSGHAVQAEEHYRLFLTKDPTNQTVLRNLASLLFDQGKSKEARPLYEQFIRQYPQDIDAHYAFSKTGQYDRERDIEVLQALEFATAQASGLPTNKKIKLCFTLGKANQDLGEYQAAFGAFQTGGELHSRAHPFDERSHFNMMDDIQSCFSSDYCRQMISSGIEDATPIFILGMPRSGSTLIEQILDSHPEVTGAGELKHLKQAIQTHLIGDKRTFSNAISHWDQKMLANTARDYLEKLQSHAESGQRVVDKMPGNFVFIGLIRQLFPNAKIIHSVRHPMATIWSCFSTLFADVLNYTYQLDVMARYYQKYQQLMNHWQLSLPPHSVYSLRYERLVASPEQQVKALLKHLDLSWDADCLNFHHNNRQVKTASIMQVRQPLYRSSIDLWKNYQSELAVVDTFLNR